VDKTPTSLYLGKDGRGTGVTKLADAESCSINEKTQLICGGKTMGAPAREGMDMAAIAPATAIVDGWSVDSNNALHWKSSKFPLPPMLKDDVKTMYANGEAHFGLFKSAMLTGGATQLYSQLGCPGGTHFMAMSPGEQPSAHHDMVWEGSNKVIPL